METILPESLDAFVCSSSFEDRCLTVPKMLPSDWATRLPILIATNADYIPEAQENERNLLAMYTNPTRCALNPSDPVETTDALMHGLKGLCEGAGNSRRLGIDVTTFTRESLLILLRCLVEFRYSIGSLIGFYNRAASYEGTKRK